MTVATQIEAHPYWPNAPLIAWAAGQGLHVTAYSPLGSPDSATLLNRAKHTTAPAAAPAGSSDAAGGAAAAVEAPQLMQHPMVLEMARRHGKSGAQV
jgi:diketogulonate reductase-like aldo/keto reductase